MHINTVVSYMSSSIKTFCRTVRSCPAVDVNNCSIMSETSIKSVIASKMVIRTPKLKNGIMFHYRVNAGSIVSFTTMGQDGKTDDHLESLPY